ncbi:unnamed protein product [Allacma fusca]|uniref:C2H2-type domain-containing protein n=1 Tax=Allacma fusca TaxID=39272 RepID=A0A8J2KKQ2_9HEXA|nr:unnamed protein product [Allacma fusca]
MERSVPKVEVIDVFDDDDLIALCEVCQREVKLKDSAEHAQIHSFAVELTQEIKSEDVKLAPTEPLSEFLRQRAQSVDSFDSGVVCSPVGSPTFSTSLSTVSSEPEQKLEIEKITPSPEDHLKELVKSVVNHQPEIIQTCQSEGYRHQQQSIHNVRMATSPRYHPYQPPQTYLAGTSNHNSSLNMRNEQYSIGGYGQQSQPASRELQKEFTAWRRLEGTRQYHLQKCDQVRRRFAYHDQQRKLFEGELMFLKLNDPSNFSKIQAVEAQVQLHKQTTQRYYQQYMIHKQRYETLQQPATCQNWVFNQPGSQQVMPVNARNAPSIDDSAQRHNNDHCVSQNQSSYSSQTVFTPKPGQNTGEYQLQIHEAPNPNQVASPQHQQQSHLQHSVLEQHSLPQQPVRNEHLGHHSGGNVFFTKPPTQQQYHPLQHVQQENFTQTSKFQQIAEAGRQYRQNVQRPGQPSFTTETIHLVQNTNEHNASLTNSQTYSKGFSYHGTQNQKPNNNSSSTVSQTLNQCSVAAVSNAQGSLAKSSNSMESLFPIHCKFCDSNFDREVKFYSHMDITHKIRNLKVGKHCHLCGKVYFSVRGHLSHLQSEHNNFQQLQKYSICQCWKCEKYFDDLDIFKLHLPECDSNGKESNPIILT